MNICLYVAISSAAEFVPRNWSNYQRLKAFIGRTVDRVNIKLGRQAVLRFHHWEVRTGINKGDIAIREAIKQQLKDQAFPTQLEIREVSWDELDQKTVENINDWADIFVIAGSGYIFSDELGELHPRAALDSKHISRLTCPVVAYGIGWNTLLTSDYAYERAGLTPAAKETLRQLFSNVSLIAARDKATQLLLVDATGRNVDLVVDPAFFFQGRRGTFLPKAESGQLRVGLNLAFHGKESVDRFKRLLPKLSDFLREISKRHIIEFHYVMHAETEKLVTSALEAIGVTLVVHDPDVWDLPGLYRCFDVNVCQMLHSAILATAARVPTLTFAYDAKSSGFFNLLGLDEFCLSECHFDLEIALTRFDDLVRRRHAIASQIDNRSAILNQASNAFLRKAIDLVK